jgi:predicted component of type VI protein secretion system
MSGQDAQALSNLEQKVQAAELMPVVQCGGLHFMLAVAAERRGETELAAWLRQRAQLFCTPQELTLAARLVRV